MSINSHLFLWLFLISLSIYLSLFLRVLVYVVCRRGNDSQLVVEILKKHFKDLNEIKDIIGGLNSWSKDIDPNFPQY